MAFYSDQEKYEKFLLEHNLTDNHYAFLWALTESKHKEIKLAKAYERFNKFSYLHGEERELHIKGKLKGVKVISSWLTQQDIDFLEKEGYLIRVLTSSNFPDTHDVTEKFYKELFIHSDIAFEELYETFPKDPIKVDGYSHNRMNVDIDAAKQLYKKKIGNSLPKHQSIIAELENQIKCDLVTVGFDKWLSGEMWRLESLKTPVTSKVKVYGENL